VYSHDMLYVADAAGTKVGHINLGSGKVTMDLPELRSGFDQFVARWRAESTAASRADETPTDDPETSTTTAENQPATAIDTALPREVVEEGPAWQDLSQNRAGQAVRERAVELRSEAPVRTFVARVFGVHTDERAYRVGADGEEEVAWRMRKLGKGWHVLHSVPVGEKDSDIDHVVIGPPGVFTLNTKNHSRKKVWVAEKAFMVSDQKTNYLRNSRHEAARASKLLTTACGFDVQVEPVIVVIAAELTIKSQPADVHVVARKRIGKWLERRPATLSPVAVEAIYEMARRDTTWRTG
ncbi:MAG: nuclease-related domain-containing protein, partial [Mycobacterium sp.]